MAEAGSRVDVLGGLTDWSVDLSAPASASMAAATMGRHGRTLWLAVGAAVLLHAVVALAGASLGWMWSPPELPPAAIPVALVAEPGEPAAAAATAQPLAPVAPPPAAEAPPPPQPVAAEPPPPVDHADYPPLPVAAPAPPPMADAVPALPEPPVIERKPVAPQARQDAEPPRRKAKAKPAVPAVHNEVAPASPSPPVAHLETPPPVAPAPEAQPDAQPTQLALAAPPPRPSSPAATSALPAGPVVPPRPVTGVAGNRKPDYPAVARSHHLQGRVVLRVQVSASGSPTAVDVVSSSGHDVLDEAALAAVRTWHFVPATQAGIPVAAPVEVPVVFRLEE